MDESWRMRMGMEARRSAGGFSRRRSAMSMESVEAEDFSDVFGGPPRSLLTRKLSGDFTRVHSFYDEIFQPPNFFSGETNSGRVLPGFRIPSAGDGFYSDVFGSTHDDAGTSSRERSRPASSKAKSKSNSSSVLSSDDFSPLRPVAGDDVGLSSFASKLRPINIPSGRSSGRIEPPKQGTSAFTGREYIDSEFFCYDSFKEPSSNYAFSGGASSPETMSLDPHSFRSVKISMADDLGPSSPASSPVLSSFRGPNLMARSTVDGAETETKEDAEVDNEIASSFVIEISSDKYHCDWTRKGEAVDLDEAIAWAKESFKRQSSPLKQEALEIEDEEEEEESSFGTGGEEEEKAKLIEQMEMEMMEEEVRMWSRGKETNIRLLLSTLHYILWPDCGWYAIPMANLRENSQLKKAYQKARLCLHPDKLQQRGASLIQKSIAQRVFSILQDAWAAYLAQQGFLK